MARRILLAILREECGSAFPEAVTAFRPAMAVHGRFQEPWTRRYATRVPRAAA